MPEPRENKVPMTPGTSGGAAENAANDYEASGDKPQPEEPLEPKIDWPPECNDKKPYKIGGQPLKSQKTIELKSVHTKNCLERNRDT